MKRLYKTHAFKLIQTDDKKSRVNNLWAMLCVIPFSGVENPQSHINEKIWYFRTSMCHVNGVTEAGSRDLQGPEIHHRTARTLCEVGQNHEARKTIRIVCVLSDTPAQVATLGNIKPIPLNLKTCSKNHYLILQVLIVCASNTKFTSFTGIINQIYVSYEVSGKNSICILM